MRYTVATPTSVFYLRKKKKKKKNRHSVQTWGRLHLNVINYYYYYTIAYPITNTIILHIRITLLYYYYYYNAINYCYVVIFQSILENINASLKYNYCI